MQYNQNGKKHRYYLGIHKNAVIKTCPQSGGDGDCGGGDNDDE